MPDQRTRSRRVLVVDDDEDVRSLAAALVRRAGFTALTAAAPREAIEMLKTCPNVDVILSDIVMPEMTGFDFATEAKRFAPGARFVFMSGFAEDHFCAPVGVPVVPKPFGLLSLAEAIAAALS